MGNDQFKQRFAERGWATRPNLGSITDWVNMKISELLGKGYPVNIFFIQQGKKCSRPSFHQDSARRMKLMMAKPSLLRIILKGLCCLMNHQVIVTSQIPAITIFIGCSWLTLNQLLSGTMFAFVIYLLLLFHEQTISLTPQKQQEQQFSHSMHIYPLLSSPKAATCIE